MDAMTSVWLLLEAATDAAVADADSLATLKKYSQLFHPAFMWVLVVMGGYVLYTGVKWKKTRTAEDKEVKKELMAKQFREKHYQVASWFLAYIILGSLGGMAVTYINNGKLFVAPHLLAGLGMLGLLGLAVAMVPYMQKGQQWARTIHVSLNLSMLGLFGWQAVSGVQILNKILGDF